MNFYILYKLYKQMQKVLNLPEGQEDEAWKIEGGGVLFNVLKRMFKLINRFVVSHHMYKRSTDSRLDLGRCTPWVSSSVLASTPPPR